MLSYNQLCQLLNDGRRHADGGSNNKIKVFNPGGWPQSMLLASQLLNWDVSRTAAEHADSKSTSELGCFANHPQD